VDAGPQGRLNKREGRRAEGAGRLRGDASGAREADGTRLRWRSWSESEDAVEEEEEVREGAAEVLSAAGVPSSQMLRRCVVLMDIGKE